MVLALFCALLTRVLFLFPFARNTWTRICFVKAFSRHKHHSLLPIDILILFISYSFFVFVFSTIAFFYFLAALLFYFSLSSDSSFYLKNSFISTHTAKQRGIKSGDNVALFARVWYQVAHVGFETLATKPSFDFVHLPLFGTPQTFNISVDEVVTRNGLVNSEYARIP